MANKAIPDLPLKQSAMIATDLLVVDDGEHSYKILWSALLACIPCISSITTENGYVTVTLETGERLSVKPSDPDKQDALTFDSEPTQNSNNPVKSGGVYSKLADKLNAGDYKLYTGAVGETPGTPGIVPGPGSADSYLSGGGSWSDDTANLIIGSATTSSVDMPVPATNENHKTILGKVIKFFNDVKTKIGTLAAGHYIQGSAIGTDITALDTQLYEVTEKVGTPEDGEYTSDDDTNAENIKSLDTALAKLGLSVINGKIAMTINQ